MFDCPLFSQREEILRRWETRSRERFPAAHGKASTELRDHLPQILDALCDSLGGQEDSKLLRLSRVHGRQRFSFGDYTLMQVIGEYNLLKEIVFDYISTSDPSETMELMKSIGTFFDEAAKTAAGEFADLRERELGDANRDLLESQTALENFAAIVAHDMRSPLATIVSFCELLGYTEEAAIRDRTVGRIASTAERTMQLIDRLLDYSRLGHHRLNRETVDLDGVLALAKDNLRDAFERADAILLTESLGRVVGDPILIGQLFQNLLANSLKFAKSDETCRIRVTAEDDFSGRFKKICVIDNGVGFAAERNEEIFKPFQRGHKQDEFTGSGLGLAICRKVVDLHGGLVTAEGEVGIGATICFTLPFATQIGSAQRA